MFYLVTNPYSVEKEIGMNLHEEFLFPKLNLDGVKMVNPMLAGTNDLKYLLCRDHERGYLQHKTLPKHVHPLAYKPYFTFQGINNNSSPKDLISAIIAASNEDKHIHVELDIPVALYHLISEKFEIDIAGGNQTIGGVIGKTSIKEVNEIFSLPRYEGEKIAAKMIDTLSTDKKDILKQYIAPKESRHFETLNQYMKDNDLDTILVSSPLNVQELTGIPLLYNEGGIIALYKYNDSNVYFLKTDQFKYIKQGNTPLVAHKEFSSLISSGTIGIESEDLNLGQFFGLGLATKNVKPISVDLRSWREKLAGEDLSFYIISAQASRFAIETAMSAAYNAINNGSGINELEIENIYLNAVQDFFDKNKLPYIYEPYFTNLHSGARFETPSCGKDYLITKSSKTIKLDSGIKLYSLSGHLLGASDIARTAVFSDNGKKAYDILESIMVNQAIPSAKIGLKGSVVYNTACEEVDKCRKEFEELDMTPTFFEKLSDVFDRDTGHLMGKQEVVSFYFTKSEIKTFTEGMICCFEFQWPHKGHAFGVEDSFVITTEGAINFTR